MKERKKIIPNENPRLYIISKWEEDVGEDGEKSVGVSYFPILAWEIDSREGEYDFCNPEPISLWGRWSTVREFALLEFLMRCARRGEEDAIYDADLDRWWRVRGGEFGIGIQGFMDRTGVK